MTTAKDGKNYKTKYYNLDLIISVGYRVYRKTHLTQAEKDYLEIMGEDIKKLNG